MKKAGGISGRSGTSIKKAGGSFWPNLGLGQLFFWDSLLYRVLAKIGRKAREQPPARGERAPEEQEVEEERAAAAVARRADRDEAASWPEAANSRARPSTAAGPPRTRARLPPFRR